MNARGSLRQLLPWVGVASLSLLFRLPALINAAATNSDAAIVGLQAMHLLRGEWSALLFGSTYQTSADSVVAAGFFAALGPTPLALMLSSLTLHVALTLMAMLALRRHVPVTTAAVLSLTLVLTTSCLHSYALYPPRQLSLTLAMAALLALDGATSRARFAAGGLLTTFAWLADPYAMLLFPALCALAALGLHASRDRWRSAAAWLAGLGIGGALLAALALHPQAQRSVAALSFSVVSHNAALLVDSCFPWMSGAAIYAPAHWMDYERLAVSLPLQATQWLGVAVVSAAAVYGALAMARAGVAPGVRRLAAFAWVAIASTLGGFLLSRMVMDQFSMRYLAAIVVVLPFALLPLGVRLGATRLLLALSPYLVQAAIGGWLGFGPYVSGATIVLTASGRANDEAALVRALEARGVREAIADYWSAYRLTFLARERVVFVPLHAAQDRYAPYRARFERAPRVAYVFDELRSFESRADTERDWLASGAFAPDAERIDIGVFHALVLTRAPAR